MTGISIRTFVPLSHLLACMLLTCAAGAASGHGMLERAIPAADSTVHGSPAEVTLSFSQALEPAFSTLRVVDAGGKQIDREDKSLGADARQLRVSLPPLAPGPYRVIWRVLSKDGHVSSGDLTFTVAP